MSKKWICQKARTNKYEISDQEMKQRLAEVINILFNKDSQLSLKPSPIQEFDISSAYKSPQKKRAA